MTLKKSQVENLHTYLYSIYSKELDKLETERINIILESENFKTLFNKIKNFYTEIGYDYVEYDIRHMVYNILDINDKTVNHWIIKNHISNKINAILSTLPQDTDFEDVVKLVGEKLQLEETIKEVNN